MSVWVWILIVVLSVALAIVITAFIVSRRDAQKVSFMMDALEDGELNFRFRENTLHNRALNRIRGIFERRSAADEAASWNRLFRVMTHEIMNTIAPIASLSDALQESDDVDVKAGLETISASSKNLIRFVDSYRNFTQMSPPARKAVMVDEMINSVLTLNKAKMAEQGISLTYEAQTPELLVYADEGQMMLVFNNLMKNAVQAGATAIRITAVLNSDDQTVIRVSNNGKAVPAHLIEDIFVPFYTTKQNGTGIGLSLSRQIMLRHNGDLRLEQSDNNLTVFAAIFK